jgi:hypothetical protein
MEEAKKMWLLYFQGKTFVLHNIGGKNRLADFFTKLQL